MSPVYRKRCSVLLESGPMIWGLESQSIPSLTCQGPGGTNRGQQKSYHLLILCFTCTSLIGHSVLSPKACSQILLIQCVGNPAPPWHLGIGHDTNSLSLVLLAVLRFCMAPTLSIIPQCFFIVDDVFSHSHFGGHLETSRDIFGLHSWRWVQLASGR